MSDPRTTPSLADRFLARARKAMEVGSEAADVLVHLQHGLSPVGLAAVGLRVVNSVREHRATSPEEYFAQGWRPLDVGPLSHHAMAAARTDPESHVEEVPGMYDDLPALVIRLGDCTYGWSLLGNVKDPKAKAGKCWVPESCDSKVALARLGQSVWVQLGALEGLLSVRDGQVELVEDDDGEALPSARADDLHDRLKGFIDKGVHRSVFILGGPGVGKSTLMRYIAGRFGGLRLRIRLSKSSKLKPESLIRISQMLKPRVLCIDDIDRFVMGRWGDHDEGPSRNNPVNATAQAASMLDPLQVFGEIVPLVMASANFSKTITAALLRPGRFDEIETIDKLDDELYGKLLPEAPEKVIKELIRKKVPIAFIQEMRKRIEVLGYGEAFKEMNALVERSNRVLALNRRRVRARPKNPLVGKTPRQRAALLDRRAASTDLKAKKLLERAARMAAAADRDRAKAQVERKKKSPKKKSPKKKSPKKKSTKKPTKKPTKRSSKKKKTS